MKRLPFLLPLVLLAGCGLGSTDAGGGDDDSDKRALAMECFAEEGIDARLEGEQEIVIGDPPSRGAGGTSAPRVKFFLTSGESEAVQLRGDAEGAEQIGPALLFVGDGSDELLEDVELCLADL